jgi:hypothetical protein
MKQAVFAAVAVCSICVGNAQEPLPPVAPPSVPPARSEAPLPQPAPGASNPSGTNTDAGQVPPLTNSVSGLNTNAARPGLRPMELQAIQRVMADLSAVRPAGQITPANRRQLVASLRAAALGNNRPSDLTLMCLVNDLLATWPRPPWTISQRQQLAIDFVRLLNSESLTPSELQAVLNDAQAVLLGGGLLPMAVDTLLNDLAAVAAEVRKTETSNVQRFGPESSGAPPALNESAAGLGSDPVPKP